jgi:hypothetical protein
MQSLLSTIMVAGLVLVSVHSPAVLAVQADPNRGLVIFHRADVMKARAIRFNIEQDGRPIGQLLAGATLEVPLAPGTYTFTVRAPSVDGMDYLTLNVEAGKTYRVEGEVLWGWPAGRPKFANVSEFGVATKSANAPPPGAPSPSVAASASLVSKQSIGADDAGRLGLRNFVGEWNIRMWSLTADGRELEGRGIAQGKLQGEDATRIVITEFEAPEFPDAIGGGRVLIKYEPGRGFSLETDLSHSDEVLKLTGGYEVDTNKYVFYLVGGAGGKTATGISRTSVRLEIRMLDIRSWVAETFASVDGQTMQIQSTRFTRR